MSRVRGPRGRHWCFTSFLGVLPKKFDKNIVRYCVYQREVSPETKSEHFQGYIEFFDDKRMGQVKTVLGECHLEIRHGSRYEAREYCKKKDSAIADSQVEFGLWREDLSRKRKLGDMLKTDMTLDQIIELDPMSFVRYHRGLEKLYYRRQKKKARTFRKVQVSVYLGPTGSGKSRKALSSPNSYPMPCSDKLWFDGYEGEKTLVIDDYSGDFRYSRLLRILDGHMVSLPRKGAFVWALWDKVIITSNISPDKWYPRRSEIDALRRRINRIVYFPIISIGDLVINK